MTELTAALKIDVAVNQLTKAADCECKPLVGGISGAVQEQNPTHPTAYLLHLHGSRASRGNNRIRHSTSRHREMEMCSLLVPGTILRMKVFTMVKLNETKKESIINFISCLLLEGILC